MTEKYPFTIIKEEIARRKGAALDFAVGTSPFPLSPEMSDWLHEHSALALVPGNRDDIRRFTKTAAGFLSRQYGVEIAPEQILPTAGGRAAMGILAACTLSPDSTVMVTEPGYPAFARLAAQLGAKVLASQLDPDNGFAPDFEYSAATPEGSLSMLAVNYPNNPSGCGLSSAVLGKLHSLARAGQILFNDATYGPLVYDEPARSLLSERFAVDARPTVIELHSFSKLYPIGPQALSFLAGDHELIDTLSTYSEYAWSPLSRLQLAATAKCLEDSDRLDQIRGYVPGQLRALQETLDAIGFRSYPAQSGTYLICDAPREIGGESTDSAHSAARLLMDRFDIAAVPLGAHERSYLRFTALYRPADLEKLAELATKLRVR